MKRDETHIMTVAHGGLLRFAMVLHPNIIVVDGRELSEQRFGNCELREYTVEFIFNSSIEKDGVAVGVGVDVSKERPLIVLTEVM